MCEAESHAEVLTLSLSPRQQHQTGSEEEPMRLYQPSYPEQELNNCHRLALERGLWLTKERVPRIQG